MKIETLLKSLVTSKYDEMHLEPNREPYFSTEEGRRTAADLTLTSQTISAAVFPVIPTAEKMRLPGLPKINFDLVNELGRFSFVVSKSPTGLCVAIKTLESFYVKPNGDAPAPAQTFELAGASPSAPPINAPAPAAMRTPETFRPANGQTPNYQPPPPVVEPQMPVSANKFAPRIELPEFPAEVVESPAPAPPIAPPVAPPVAPAPQVHAPAPQFEIAKAAPPPREAAQVRGKMDNPFFEMAEARASDLHMSVSSPPFVRKDGKMQILNSAHETLTPDSMRELLWSIMPEKNREEFERRHDTDFAYEIKGLARFRANIFMDRKGMGGVFRIIPSKILTAKQLGLSQPILDLCDLSKGLVVVTGPTGSGKSTTLCAMIDHINDTRADHLITIEDPIEFTHENKKCLVNQREVHNHTDSFKDALRAALREDPDILLVGEMRDLETISIAIETAETGHLVFGTLHTTTATSTVDRIIDQFPADRQQQIRVMLSESLKGVIAQTLLPKKGGGRVAAMEVLIITPAISNLIREGKTFQIASAMQTGKQIGMVVLNDALMELVKNGLVEPRDAYLKAVDKTGFEGLLKRNKISF